MRLEDISLGFTIMFVTVLQPFVVTGQCNRDPNPEFYTKKGYYFRNHVTQELTADQEYVCRIKCYLGDSCMSYNCKTNTGRCEINDSDEHQHPHDLVLQDDNIYGGTQNDCVAKPCPSHTLCKANVRTLGFKCLCFCNRGQCNRDPNPEFYTKKGSYFRNHVIQELTADQEYVCRIKCYRGDSCMSYNYKTSTGRCEINDSDEHQHPQDLVPQDDNIYGGTQRFVYVLSDSSSGCFYLTDMPCDRALGMEDGRITNSQVKASSYYNVRKDDRLAPWNARLRLKTALEWRGGWAAAKNSNGQWLQVDLRAKAEVTGIATQGLYDLHQWVKTYSIRHSDDDTTFIDYNRGEVLTGNADRNTIVKHNLKQFSARFVRVLPKSWKQHIAMRLELYGCNPGSF
ncbi:hypothetical protein QZH41_016836 [Actinostola sp. cb2023]|nr:hypothetical protein QZH41_016836 [Actinostola sp. cb2023]